jgi:CheY-like chemotaxis protein
MQSRRPLVLIVEDELLVAMELAGTLERSGYRILGPAPSVHRALAILEDEWPDGALLDVNLRGERVTPVARELRARGIPYVLVTAFNPAAFAEPELRSVPVVRKPISDDGEVARALEGVL